MTGFNSGDAGETRSLPPNELRTAASLTCTALWLTRGAVLASVMATVRGPGSTLYCVGILRSSTSLTFFGYRPMRISLSSACWPGMDVDKFRTTVVFGRSMTNRLRSNSVTSYWRTPSACTTTTTSSLPRRISSLLIIVDVVGPEAVASEPARFDARTGSACHERSHSSMTLKVANTRLMDRNEAFSITSPSP